MPSSQIRAVLIDLSGTLHVGDKPIAGAVDACRRLQSLGVPVKYLTNTSKTSSSALLKQLRDIGFDNLAVPDGSIMTSTTAARNMLIRHKLRPLCLVENVLMDDLTNVQTDSSDPNCVLVGLAPNAFCYGRLNEAFRLLMKLKDERDTGHSNNDESGSPISPLIAIHRGKYLRDVDGELSLGPGGFVSCLEEAAGVEAITVGKPSKSFFQSAIAEWLAQGIEPEEIAMIGDDAEQDVNGAIRAGLGLGILVQTGKYRPGDEDRLLKRPDGAFAAKDIAYAVTCITPRL